jgi:hypothetical protein
MKRIDRQKSEARNPPLRAAVGPKSETNPNHQNSNDENKSGNTAACFSVLVISGFRISDLFRISSFGFRAFVV